MGGIAGGLAVDDGEVLGAAKIVPMTPCGRAEQKDRVALGFESRRRAVRVEVFDQPQHADGGGGENGAFGVFIIERHVAAGDGRAEGAARLAHAADGLFERPVDLRLVRVAEVEAVGDSQRFAPGANHVARGLGHGNLPAPARVEVDVAPIAIGLDGEAFVGAFEPHQRRIARPRPDDRVRAHHRVVLFEDPALRGDVGCAEQGQQGLARRLGRHVGERLEVERAGLVEVSGTPGFALVDGGAAAEDEVLGRHVGHQLAVPVDPDAAPRLRGGRLGDFADLDGVQVPFLEDDFQRRLTPRLADDEHALLAFGKHDLVGRHVGFAHGHLVEVEHHAAVALGAHLAGGARQARRAHVLNADDDVRREGFERGLQQEFFGKRIADLHAGASGFALFGDFFGSKRSAVDAVAPRR